MGCLSSGKTKVKSYSTLTPDQQKLASAMTQYLQPMIGQSVTPYSGQRVAGTSPLQNSAFNLANTYTPEAIQGYQQAVTNVLDSVANQDMSSIFAPIAEYTGQQWENRVVPQLMESFAGMGAGDSGGAMQALLRSAEDSTQTGLAATLAPYMMQARSQALQTVPMYQDVANMPMNIAGAQAQLGEAQRGITQQALTAEQQKWLESQPYNSPIWNLLPIAMGQQLENVGVQKGAGLGASVLGGVAGGFGGAMGNWFGNKLG